MGALTRLACLATLAGLGLTLMACGQSDSDVALTAEERALWAPRSPDRSVVPVLLVRDVDAFARQMALLDHAGYTTITLDDLVRFVRRHNVDLPPHPLLLTFDGGRKDTWTGADETLRRLGMKATLFVDVGRVEGEDPSYLTWDELDRLARSDRWDVQLQSGTGNRPIRYGAGPDDVGPFYAYRGAEEVLGGWRERVFSDITYGEEQLAFHVQSYRPLAIAPPEGNYGQAGSNDPRIARELRARLLDSFELIFTQDRSGLARPGASNPFGRIEVTRDVTGEELHALLTSENHR
jgi:peptidoglycan/xylan/chitin deacetylase (PgdA/CDA1 family)